jgi:hypothetical protein
MIDGENLKKFVKLLLDDSRTDFDQPLIKLKFDETIPNEICQEISSSVNNMDLFCLSIWFNNLFLVKELLKKMQFSSERKIEILENIKGISINGKIKKLIESHFVELQEQPQDMTSRPCSSFRPHT